MAERTGDSLMKRIFQLSTKTSGKDKIVYGVTNAGDQLAIATVNSSTIQFFNKSGQKEEFTIQIPGGTIQDFVFSSDNQQIAVLLKDKVSIHGLSQKSPSPVQIQSEIGNPCFISWSPNSQTLVIGTTQGGLVLYSIRGGKKVNVSGKHSKKITHITWTSNDTFVSRSEDDTVQVTKENGENVDDYAPLKRVTAGDCESLTWIENANLIERIAGAKPASIPENDKKNAKYMQNLERLRNGGTGSKSEIQDVKPRQKKTNPLLIMSYKGGKEALVIPGLGNDSETSYKITPTSNQGRVIAFGCSSNGDLLMATSRGQIVKFAFTETGFVEMQSERIFQNQMDFCNFDSTKNKALVSGDNQLKMIELKTLKEEREYRVNFDKNFGTVACLLSNRSGSLIFAASTQGALHGFMVQSEQKGKLFARYYSVKTSLCEIMVKRCDRRFDSGCVEELESASKMIIFVEGSEIIDYAIAQNRIVVAQEKELTCYDLPTTGGESKQIWRITFEHAIRSLIASEKSKVLVLTANDMSVIDVCSNNSKRQSVSLSRFPNSKIRFFDNFTALLSRGSLTVFDNATLRQVLNVALTGTPTEMFVNEQSFEFMFYDPNLGILSCYAAKFDKPFAEVQLPEKLGLVNVLFDTKDANIMCAIFESGKVYTLCKRGSHYKNVTSYNIARDILQPSDLDESCTTAEYAVTIVDTNITPLRLTDGYLFCLEKGVTPTGCFLSSHSYRLGNFERIASQTDIKNGPITEDTTLRLKKSPEYMLTSENEAKTGRDFVTMDKATISATNEASANTNSSLSESEKEYLLKTFFQTVELNLFAQSLKACDSLRITSLWNILAEISLKNMNLEVAKACYQKLGNWSMSYYIQNLLGKRRLAAEIKADIAVILCDYEYAKACYLQMDQPGLAVELLMNLHEFTAAYDLAKMYNLSKHELLVSYELAELDLKNEDYIKAESGFDTILKRLASVYGVTSVREPKHSGVSTITSNSSIKVGKENEIGSVTSAIITNKENRTNNNTNYAESKANVCRRFNATNLYKNVMFSLTCLYIRQGILLRAADTLGKLSNDNLEELEELATVAKECEQYSLAAEIYQRIKCSKREMEARLLMITKSPNNASKQVVSEFTRAVSSKIDEIDDSDILLKLAEFFQDKEPSLADTLFKRSGNLVERIKFVLQVQNDVDRAERIFQESNANIQQSACLIADYFTQNMSRIQYARQRAIKYFLFSGRKIEAMKTAFEINAVDEYCQYVTNFDEREANTLAKYFVSKGKFDRAGKFFLTANQYEKALLSFVQAKDFDSAIDLVYKLNDDELFDLMVQVFAGETLITANERISENLLEGTGDSRQKSAEYFDVCPKNQLLSDYPVKSRLESIPEPVDPIYLFKLYLKFGKTDQANTIALAIIDRELIDGSYKSAYSHSCTISTLMTKAAAKITAELKNKIVVLQSYVLMKKALKFENHTLAALLLNRVCSFLHYLPKHDTEILTSAVIEATKAGLKLLAYNWALSLCKPQHRSKINPKFKERIEKIALKPVQANEMPVDNFAEVGWAAGESKAWNGVAKCPCCQVNAPDAFALSCSACFNNFVICMASGKALLLAPRRTFKRCKSCLGIAYETELNALMAKDPGCPTCESKDMTGYETFEPEMIIQLMKG